MRRTQPTILLQILRELLINSKVILKSSLGPDDICDQIIICLKFDGEILRRTQLTILLQILCELLINSKVNLRNVLDADDFCHRLGMNGLTV